MVKAFEDRSDELFGREADVQYLLDRAQSPGVTALVAPPLMGKTWTLTEVGHRLSEGDQYLVGYYESIAAESSALLYAVANLYERWLSDSSMREQALSLWQRHKKDLVPRVGQMAGKLFEKLAGHLLLEEVGAVVREALEGLASAQDDLLNGGYKLPKLPYDQALSLTKLVATISKRRVVLILDAWEKSRSIDEESAALEAFLRHRNDWPHTHVFLAIQSPGQDSTQENKDARSRAENLRGLCPAAKVVKLKQLNLTDAREQARVESYVRNNVPAAKQVKTQTLIQMIDGYPGVLNFWIEQATSPDMQTGNDLHREARNAQSVQYQFNYLFNGLEGDHLTLAARLALLPRLNAERWETFRQWLMEDLPDSAVDKLYDSKVLRYEGFPMYGHDTRHAAARRWLIENKRPLMVRTAEGLIKALAAEIHGIVSEKDYLLLAELAACSAAAQSIGLSPAVLCLIDAAKTTSGDIVSVFKQSFDQGCRRALQINPSVAPLLSIALLNRGIVKGDRGDGEGAIADFTAVIELRGVSSALLASALYHRGRAKGLCRDFEGAIADFTATIATTGATSQHVGMAFYNRGVAKGMSSDESGAFADYTATSELPGVAPEQIAQALVNRSGIKEHRGDHKGAIADNNAVIELPGAPLEYVKKALYNRGLIKERCGDQDGAIIDFTSVIELPGASGEPVACAFYARGVAKGRLGDQEGEIADCTATIEFIGASVEILSKAFYARGNARLLRRDLDGAIADFTEVLRLPEASPKRVAKALNHRGVARGMRGDLDGAITDFTAAIDLPGASPESIAKSLGNRGIAKGMRGDHEGEIADYNAACEFNPVQMK